MKRIYLCLIACLTILAIILSGCAGRENNSDGQSAVLGTEQIENLSGEIRVEKVKNSDEESPQDNTLAISTDNDSETNNSSAAGTVSAHPNPSQHKQAVSGQMYPTRQ